MKALADYREADLRVPKGAPFYFRYGRLAAETDIELHTHPWGQLSRISLGLLEMTVESRRLTAPAEYLIWVPANLPHASSIRQATDYISVYVAKPLAMRLPATSCLIPQTRWCARCSKISPRAASPPWPTTGTCASSS